MENKVIIFDALFSTKSFQNIHMAPSYFEWQRPEILDIFNSLTKTVKKKGRRDNSYELSISFNNNPPVFFSEQFYRKADLVDSDKKIALIMEPRGLHPENYTDIKQHEQQFKYILTHNLELLDTDPSKYLYYPFGGSWINPMYVKIYDKIKNISACFSAKRTMIGHEIRHEIFKELKGTDKCDFFGKICNNHLYDKVDAIKDYRFHFAIENVNTDDFFTEKIVDCFLLGTIPIYWGTKNIGKYFDINGIVVINSMEELLEILPSLDEKYYEKRIKYVERNFELAKQYMIPEDWIYKKYPFLFK